MSIKLTLEIPEELSQRAIERASLEGTTVSEILLKELEEFASGRMVARIDRPSLKIAQFKRDQRLSPQELEESKIILEKMRQLAQQIGLQGGDKVDAAALVKEGRREL